MNSIMGQFWTQSEYVPAVTFDLNFNGTDSKVYLGMYNNSDNLVFTGLPSGLSSDWALNVYTATWGVE